MKIIEIAAIVISPIYVHLILNNCSSMLENEKKFVQREWQESIENENKQKEKGPSAVSVLKGFRTSYRAFGGWPVIGGAIH